jgi:hypothetical protein
MGRQLGVESQACRRRGSKGQSGEPQETAGLACGATPSRSPSSLPSLVNSGDDGSSRPGDLPRTSPVSAWLKASTLWWALVCAASAAPLPDTPSTLIEQSILRRESVNRVWDPASGRLGNLAHVSIVANGCTVRVVSGPENRLLGPREGVQVSEDPVNVGHQKLLERTRGVRPYPERNVTLTVRAAGSAPPRGTVCLTLQVASADNFLLNGNDMTVLFDRVEMPTVTVHVNSGAPQYVWFQDVRLGRLAISSNGSASIGGSGHAQWLTLGHSNVQTTMFFHEMNALNIGVSPLVTHARVSIRIEPGKTRAGYLQEANGPAHGYPIWIDGPLNELEMPVRKVNAMPLTASIRRETHALRDEVLGRAGPPPVLTPSDPASRPPSPPQPVSAGQRVADAFERYLPAGVRLTAVDLWKEGGAAPGVAVNRFTAPEVGKGRLTGYAPDDVAVGALVKALSRSPDVRHARVGLTRPQGGEVAFSVSFILSCTAPGEASICLPGNGPAYTEEQIRAELLPLLGPQVKLTRLTLVREREVTLEASTTRAQGQAIYERIRQLPWLGVSTTIIGDDRLVLDARLTCPAPPVQGGICRAPVAKR